jgi:hypothetical protein
MTHIIVKDGRVAVSGGRVVTSAGGAPCCCDGGACYIIMLACGCDDLRQALYTPVGSAIDLAWPYADRLAGRAISVNGVCYRYIGSTTTVPPFADLLSGAAGTVYDSCDDSPCSDQAACPPCPGGFVATLANGVGFPVQFLWECVQSFRVECVASIEVVYSATATETFTESNAGQVLNEHSVQLAVDFTATFTGAGSASNYSVTESSAGYARRYSPSGGLTDEDVWDYQDTHTTGISTGDLYSESVSQSLLPGVRVFGASGSDITNGVGFGVPSSSNALLQSPFVCNGSFNETTTAGDGATTTQASSSSVSHSPTASSVSVTSRKLDTDGDYFVDLEWASSIQVARRITLVDGTVIDLVQCDGPGGGGGGGGTGPTDIGDPQPEPDFDVQDDGTIPGLGDMVAEAIRTISLNTILPCSACERRKQVLNRFGERAGRAVIRLLRW